MNAARLLAVSLAAISVANAAPVFTTGSGEGVTTDLFDVAQSAQVISSSPQHPCCGNSDPRQIIGFVSGGAWVEPGHSLFQDGSAVGTVDFLEWQTAGPVNLTGLALRLQQDGFGNTARGAGTFKLLASADGVNFSQVSAGTMPGSPGANVNKHWGIILVSL